VKSRIGLFGGTFDPVHNGHVEITQAFLNSELIDQIWVIPAAYPPHKVQTSADYQHRVNMLKIAFEDIYDVIVNTVESALPKPGYTLQTLQYLLKSNADKEFFLCIGSDSLLDFSTWYRYQDILMIAKLLVANRPGSIIDNVSEDILDKSYIIDHKPINISSSNIRKSLAESRDSRDIPINVLNYILNHSLYQ
jgi:nicotinate-nucleotide adenylyltransferase